MTKLAQQATAEVQARTDPDSVGASVGARELVALKCSFPFAGRNSGTGKLTSCCPACGASSTRYTYPQGSRFKHCFTCGFDRFEQRLLEGVRADAKSGRSINPEHAMRSIAYHRKVFGRASKAEAANAQPNC